MHLGAALARLEELRIENTGLQLMVEGPYLDHLRVVSLPKNKLRGIPKVPALISSGGSKCWTPGFLGPVSPGRQLRWEGGVTRRELHAKGP